MSKKKSVGANDALTDLWIVEGISGTFFYHLSKTGRGGQPTLCSTTAVMETAIPLARWKSGAGNVGARWCKFCDEKFKGEAPEIPWNSIFPDAPVDGRAP